MSSHSFVTPAPFTSHLTSTARISVQALFPDWCFSKPGPKAFLKCKHSTTQSLITHLAPNLVTRISITFSVEGSLFSLASTSRKKIINRSLKSSGLQMQHHCDALNFPISEILIQIFRKSSLRVTALSKTHESFEFLPTVPHHN